MKLTGIKGSAFLIFFFFYSQGLLSQMAVCACPLVNVKGFVFVRLFYFHMQQKQNSKALYCTTSTRLKSPLSKFSHVTDDGCISHPCPSSSTTRAY